MATHNKKKENGSKFDYDVPTNKSRILKNKDFKIPDINKKNCQRFWDHLEAEKSLIPSPDKYSVHSKHFNDQKKNSRIMASAKKSTMDDIMKQAKQVPGAGRYDPFRFDETFNKIPKATHKYQSGQQKYSYIDEQMAISQEKPAFYTPIDMVSHYFA